jgi:hypothetical protein
MASQISLAPASDHVVILHHSTLIHSVKLELHVRPAAAAAAGLELDPESCAKLA